MDVKLVSWVCVVLFSFEFLTQLSVLVIFGAAERSASAHMGFQRVKMSSSEM